MIAPSEPPIRTPRGGSPGERHYISTYLSVAASGEVMERVTKLSRGLQTGCTLSSGTMVPEHPVPHGIAAGSGSDHHS